MFVLLKIFLMLVATTQPTSQSAKDVVEYPLPPDSEFSKLVGPIAKVYSVQMPVHTFDELRALSYTEDGAMHRGTPDPSHTSRFSVIVPESYQKQKAAGLIVWIAPENGVENREDWVGVMDRHDIIFIAPHGVENETHSVWRIFMAMEAIKHAKEKYNIDSDRVYIAGLSGGGRISSHAAVFFPEIFSGAIAMVGSNFYRDVPAGKNQMYPGFWLSPNQSTIARGRANTRLVLLTGSRDFNHPSTQAAYDAYVKDKWKYVTYLEQPDMPHARPNAEYFEKAIDALDAPLSELAESKYNQAIQLEEKRKLGEACAMFESAALHGGAQFFVVDAEKHAEMIRQKLADQFTNIHRMIDKKSYDAAMSQARRVKSDFAPIGNVELDALIAQITELKKAGK